MGKKIWFLGAILALFGAFGSSAQVPPPVWGPPQQCVSVATAGGTANAITTAALPCGTTTNLLILANVLSNTSGTVTIQPSGLVAEPVVRADGTALLAGDIVASGYSLFTNNGTSWALINPANANITPTVVCAGLTLTGDVTSTTSCATTIAAIRGTTVSGVTGTGSVVFGTGGSLSNPTISTPSVTGGTFSGGTLTGSWTNSGTVTGGTYSSPALTGTPTAPTQTGSDNSTKVATTAFVQGNLGSYLPLSGGTLTGKLTTVSSASGGAGFSLGNGTCPTSPATGDLCYAGGNLYTGNSGTIQGPFLFTAQAPPQGRLTLTSGTPVLTGNVAAAGTVYYTPYVGQNEPLWNGSTYSSVSCTEMSNVLANSAVGNAGPSAAVANTVYDLFMWNNAGVCTLTRGQAWTTNTSRTNTVVYQSGLLVNNSNIPNGPAAKNGTYVGTIWTDAGGGTVTWNTGGSASGGSAAFLDVWNYYNRVNVAAQVIDNGTSYTYTTATVREARASTGNQVNYVLGEAEDSILVGIAGGVTTTASAGAGGTLSWGLNSTTTSYQLAYSVQAPTAAAFGGSGGNSGPVFSSAVGQGKITRLEVGDGSHANTFDSGSQDVLSVQMHM